MATALERSAPNHVLRGLLRFADRPALADAHIRLRSAVTGARVPTSQLRYKKTGERYHVSIFQTNRSDISLADALATKKHVYDHVAVDSDNERAFAKRLEAADEVIVYAKLPRGFVIPTPGGGYNPDWAIAMELNGERSIYFVAETKGSDVSEDLRAAEKQNIDSAKSYFRDIAENVTFRTIDSYDALMQAIS